MSIVSETFRNVASGLISQNNRQFSEISRNNQCVCISVITCVYIENISRNIFSSQTINNLIVKGDEYYLDTKKLLGKDHKHNFLTLDEIGHTLKLEHDSFNIATEYVGSGLYPLINSEVAEHVTYLTDLFRNMFERNSDSGFVFLGLCVAVSLWKSGSHYYLFDSHSVDKNGKISLGDVARIFSFPDMENLALFLLKRSPFDNSDNQYEITRVISTKRLQIQTLKKSLIRLESSDSSDDDVVLLNLIPKRIKRNSGSGSFGKTLHKQPAVELQEINNKTNSLSLSSTPVYKDGCSTVLLPNTKYCDPKLNCNVRVLLEDIGKDIHIYLNTLVTKRKAGRRMTKIRGRPRTSKLTTEQQHRDLVKKYVNKNPDVNRIAVKKYTEKNPEINRVAVKKYTEKNPEINRVAVKKYTEKNPEINRVAVKKYTEKNPEINRVAVKKYTEKNPEINRVAVKKYTEKNPEINRVAVKKYTEINPEINREAVKKYIENNSALHKTSVTNYDKKYPGKHLPTILRKGRYIAERQGKELDEITPYRLKNPSLKSPDVFTCTHCGARLFEEEKNRAQWCCGRGRYNVTEFPPLTDPIYIDKKFLEHPRRYNDLFSFCSLSVPLGYHHPKGLSFMKILGRTYHIVYDLNYGNLNNSSLYIDDGTARIEKGKNCQLEPRVIKRIQNFLESRNPYVSLYKKLSEEPSENARLEFETTTRRTHGPVLGDQPVSTEVSAVLCCDDSQPPKSKFCIWKVGSQTSRIIDANNSFVEPFQYPLLYPEGQPGWEIARTVKNNPSKKLSLLKYTRCLLLSEERFSKFGRLSETWLIDMYARIEGQRLSYLQWMQKKSHEQGGLRSGPCDEIQAAVLNNVRRDETIVGEGKIVSGKVFLPSSFTGSPRYMKVAYLDSMAIVSRFGKPTYFLTFTACGGWDEIKLSKNKCSVHEPDKCNRVFELKRKELMRDIQSGRFFGKIAYIIWSIEFQKRGLPHTHILFQMADGGPKQGREIDQIIRADIPNDNEAGGRLKELVLQHMTHGPCGPPYRTDLPCWDKNLQRCSKFFPKQHTDTTHIDDRGFIFYKRNRENKAMIKYRGVNIEIDDRWVVPYNAALLLRYECHINLEIASARKVVKYLFKYISKGTPLCNTKVVREAHEEDEVEDYVTKRYIGATDAAWRILEFDITGRYPTVIHLQLHLEGQQNVVYQPGHEQEACEKSTSSLIIYFNRPKNTELDTMTYAKFYENYIVHARRPNVSLKPLEHPDGIHFITRRQRGECVARIFWVSPTKGEQYYLRLLLINYPCHSYEDLYALGGPQCRTFQQAAVEVGLADDQKEYFEAFEEATSFMTAFKLRQFLVMLSTIGCPVPEMWEKYKRTLSEDHLERWVDDEEKAFKYALIDIDRCLRRQGSSLLEAGLPVVEDFTTELGREKLNYTESFQKDIVQRWEPLLSSDQAVVLTYIKSLLRGERLQKVLFLDGPGGSGKTQLLKVITAFVRSQSKVVLCVASSGIAAQNLAGGTTAHSLFRLPLEIRNDSYWSITNGTQRAELIREATLLIFDETPMAHKYVIEMLDRSLRDLMQRDELFGGKIILFAGDFRQIPPVVQNARTPSDIVRASVRRSYVWRSLKQFALITAHRITGDKTYGDFLLSIGSDLIEKREFGEGKKIEQLVPLSPLQHVNSLQQLIDFVFPPKDLENPDECAKRAIICTLNTNVKEINAKILDSLNTQKHFLLSCDTLSDYDAAAEEDINDDLLHQAEGKGIPEHVLHLKVGSVCMVTRNLNFDLGLVNGTKVIIVAITRRLITCRRIGSDERFGIPRITFKFPLYPNSPIEMYRRQFPLQPCYAITIHKSQGQTIDIVGLDLRSDSFTHGQLYVALSRVRDPKNIRVLVPSDRVLDGVPYSKNVVYKELL